MHPLVRLCLSAAIVTLALAAIHDLAVRTVPNVLVAALAACAVALATLQHRLPASVAIAATLLGVAFLLWLRGCFGGADAKLLAACGLLVAPGSILPMLLAIAIAGGVLCLPYLPGRHVYPRPPAARPGRLIARVLRCEQWRLRRRGPLPYAVAIAAGTISVLLRGV